VRGSSTRTNIAGNSEPSPASGVVYSVKDLSSIVAEANAGAPPKGQHDAAVTALQRLGPRINIVGVRGGRTGNVLGFSDSVYQATYSVYVNGYELDEDAATAKRSGTSELGVSCRFTKLDTWIEVDKCHLISLAGARRANLALHRDALERKPIPSSAFLTTGTAGLKNSDVEGVYLKNEYGFGVGGMMIQEFVPLLVLRSGLLYSGPIYAPQAFNAKLSQEKEPQRWGRVVVSGNKGTVTWLESRYKSNETTYSPFHPTKPAPPGTMLRGTFSRTTGGGNTAYGGNTNIISVTSFTFFADGQFARGAIAGGAGGNDYTGATANVAFRSQAADRRGHYRLDGWSIELAYDDGKTDRLLFCVSGTKLDFICIGDTMYVLDQ
jgi:hypothetical protein